MPDGKRPSAKNDKQREARKDEKDEAMSKQRAARIANSPGTDRRA
jgi:hypothetical protein